MNNGTPRRPAGLPSNPRQGASLKTSRSQPDLGRRPLRSITPNEPLPASQGGGRYGDRPRPQAQASTSRQPQLPSRPQQSLRNATSPTLSESALPPIGASLRKTGKMAAEPFPRPRTSLDSRPPPTNANSTRGELNELDQEQEQAVESNAASLWKNVAALLTVNVSKALAMTVTEGDGEATPIGAESRLTKAMKSYHLSKARDTSDLPDWLFNDSERRVNSTVKRPQNISTFNPAKEQRPKHQPSRSEALPQAPSSRPSTATSNTRDFRTAGTTAERLQALRERRKHVDKAASTSGFGNRERQASRPVALPSGR
ncbi:hypothetical protein DFP72DRAFT_870300 [Ephemerocybe angulata]|uniref:Uncharacterized protein n=1 Tax=Ephemerocybe angulata TaxID=980116 RepID=A0A8H6MG62_9AGAR|nr:hypothetical protein DFP72DRAFT_870300 [Tulosesus angulatus]